MKNCADCTHEKSVGRWDAVARRTEFTRTCFVGNDALQEAWWAANGHKTRNDVMDELPCFQATKIAIMLDSILEKVEDLHHEINKLNT